MNNCPAPMRCGACGLPYDNVTHWPDGTCGFVPFTPVEPVEPIKPEELNAWGYHGPPAPFSWDDGA